MGNKIHCFREKGIYVLEEGPAMLAGMACAHAGSGGMAFYDGVPDDTGHFVTPELREPILEEYENVRDYNEAVVKYELDSCKFNGRLIKYFQPAVMGMWQLMGGTYYGLTLKITGNAIDSPSPIITVTWQALKR